MMFQLLTRLCAVSLLVLLSQSAGSFWNDEPESEEECPYDDCIVVYGSRQQPFFSSLSPPRMHLPNFSDSNEGRFHFDEEGGRRGDEDDEPDPWDMDDDGVMDCVHHIYDRPGGRVAVSSPKGPRTDPINGTENAPHNGTDFPVETGTWLFAPEGGRVIAVTKNIPDGTGSGGGNVVLIEHPDGRVSAFLHMKQNSTTLAVGDTVETGDYLGMSNDTGRTDGVHLHYSLRTEEWARDKRPAKKKVKDLNLYHDPEEAYSDCGEDGS